MPELDSLIAEQPTPDDPPVVEGVLTLRAGGRYARVGGQPALWGPLVGAGHLAEGDALVFAKTQDGTPYVVWPGAGGRAPGAINVQQPPAGLPPVLPDGTNQSANAQALIAWVEAQSWPKATLYWPGAEYRVCNLRVSKTGVNMRGDGVESTILRRPVGVNGTLLRIGGTTWPNHARYNQLDAMTLHGNDGTGLLLYPAYVDNLLVPSLKLTDNLDTALDFTECWDSHFGYVISELCGGTDGTKPAVYLRCGRAASGDGSTPDSTNMIHFANLRVEAWRDGGLWIDKGPTGFTGNGFYFDKLKVESFSVRGRGIWVNDARGVKVRNFYVYLGAFGSGFSTPVFAIEDSGNDTLFEDGEIGNGGVATISYGVWRWANSRSTYKRVRPIYGTPPTSGQHVYHAGGYAPTIEDCVSSLTPP